MVNLYVHKKEQFLANSKNGLVQIQSINHIEDTELTIRVSKLISSLSTQCEEEATSFDSCVKYSTYLQMHDQCNRSYNTKSLMRKMLDLDKTGVHSCPVSCTQVNIGMRLTPINWLDVLVTSKHLDKMLAPGYYMTIPSAISFTEMYEGYTLVSFIAELGGWVGLFLGVSLLVAVEFTSSKLCKLNENMYCKVFVSKCLTILKIACSMGVAFIFVKCCLKVIEGETSTDIYIENRLPNNSIALCSTKNVYNGSAYIGNSSSFWTNLTKVSNIIAQIVFVYETGELVTAFDSEFEQNFTNVFYTLNTPQFNTFIETCHTMDLKHWNRIKRMEVIAKKESRVYVHITGQLLRSGRQGFSFMNKETTNLNR